MPDIDGLEATRRTGADGRFAGLPILAMTANASLADREAAWRRMNDHVAKPIDKERLVLCLLGHLGRSGAVGAPATAADAGELVEARGDIVGRFRRQPGAGSSVRRCGAFRTCRTSSPSSNASSARAMSWGSAATLHTIKGSASTAGASAWPAVPASRSRSSRRADPRRGMEILAGIRLDELRTLCDACLLRLQAMFGDVQAESAS